MKKIILSMIVAFIATSVYSQRNVDWSLEQILLPTEMQSTTNGTTVTYELVLKNNGTDSVFITDSVTVNITIYLGSSPVVSYPAANKVLPLPMKKNMGVGDTMHLRGSFSFNLNVHPTAQATILAYSDVRKTVGNAITPETSTTNANNAKQSTAIWYNIGRWALSVASVNTDNLNVYPNPAKDFFTATLKVIDVTAPVLVSIFDMTGKAVYTNNFGSEREIKISTENLKTGVYIVKINNGSQNSTSKLIVE